MTSKTNTPAEGVKIGPLQRFALLDVAGPDAAAFLQRQCMNDVRALDRDGAMQWSGLLTAKGRVLFLFRLLRLAADHFVLLAADADGDALAAELRRYVFRSKLQLGGRHWHLGGTIGSDAGDPAALPWDEGRWIVLQPADTTMAAAEPAIDDAWHDLDIARGIPRIGPALADRFTPQMLGLARLHAFSLTKGCYPGQEIVARTHYLGQQKREWTVLRAGRALNEDEPVMDGEREAGRLLQVAITDRRIGAAVLPREASPAFRLADGSALEPVADATA